MLGHYFRSLDEKNRVIIPSKFRNQLGKLFYLTLDMDNVIVLRDSKAFESLKNKLFDNNMFDKNARAFTRALLGNTFEVEFDMQGRIIIPDSFKQKTLITKDVVFIGVGDKVELWSKNAYEEHQAQFASEDSLDNLAQKLLNNGAKL